MNSRKVREFFPSVYDEVLEIDRLAEAEDAILDMVEYEIARALGNQFIMTSDYSGIEEREKMLGIIADPNTENIGFRRERLLNRYAMQTPFTLRFLKQKLDEIVGVGNWTTWVDYPNYTLYVQSTALDQNWYNELEFTINSIKPANIVFTNNPLLNHHVLLSETVDWSRYVNNYVMDQWVLGAKPFISIEQQGEIVMAGQRSIQDVLLEDVAGFIITDIVDAYINNTTVITDFITKQTDGTQAIIEYNITPAMTSTISNIKLRGVGGKVLTDSNVYIPVTNVVRTKHTIPVSEGVNVAEAGSTEAMTFKGR